MLKNGAYNIEDILDEHTVLEAVKQIDESHGATMQIVSHTAHLSKLDPIAESLGVIETKLIGALTGETSGPSKFAMQMIKILGTVIVGLTIVIVFLLTGLHFGWITPVH